MEDVKKCLECKTTVSQRFRQLGAEMWQEVVTKGLVRESWHDKMMLCSSCYMKYVVNPIKRGKKVTKKDVVEEIKIEVKEKQKPIYKFDELRRLLEDQDSNLIYFFDQLYLAARPSERNNQTMERMKKIIVFICYLLASLNNTQINAFKSDLAFYLDSARTSNKGLNTMANIGITTTSRTVNRKKKKISETHEEYVRDDLIEYLNNALILNIDDYHNIHVQQQPRTTATSLPTHMATIVANPCLTLAIPRNQVLNPKIVDGELIIRNIDKRFIVNLGVPYYNYDDRLAEKKSERHIKNCILFDFVERGLKGIEGYLDSLQTKALLDNPNIPEFVMAFLPMMGPLHVSLNARELVFKKNAFLFNDIYKSIFGIRKDLGKKPRPWRIDLILYIVHLVWFEIDDFIFSKFGYACKNIEFLYLTNLFNNLVPLVLNVYAYIIEKETETNHPIINFIINHLATLSDSPVEIFHSIIRQRTSKFSTGEQLRIAAHTAYQQRHDNDFQQQFVRSEKYPYSPKQLHMLSQKCTIYLLELFTKIYRIYDISSFIISSSNNINIYKLSSLGYEITDRYLPRGFVTSKKPNIFAICDSIHCNTPYDLSNGSIRKNTDALIKSLTKSLGENLSKKDIEEDKGDDKDPNEIHEISDDVMVERQLEDAKKLFFEMYKINI
ncbi:hypothetical protein C2G38_2182720 [Gigaspora rosea]|uniref:Uncharacterized protein n=1 Tax=Gigaspora rosea TaxID=44941 RepID=A0A397VIM2_9GLOM|nr:hypothetical protein C2G38_2182720 [Gigaspora rosea]